MFFLAILKKAYALFVTLCYLYGSPEPARIRPRPIPVRLLQSACKEHQFQLSAQETKVCQTLTDSAEDVLLDFASTTCGYNSDCSRDPEPIPDRCPIDVTPGVLSKVLLNETLDHIEIGGPYQRLKPTLECLRDNPDFSQYIKSMHIEFHRANSEWEFLSHSKFDYPPPTDALIRNASSLFLDALKAMPNLSNLIVHVASLPRYQTAFQEIVTQQTPLSLSIQHLSLGAYTEPLIMHCPNLKSTSMHEWWRYFDDDNRAAFPAFLRYASNTSATDIQIYKHITSEDFALMLETIPLVEKLSFVIGFHLEEHIPVLRQFARLELLELADVSQLRLGFDPPWCGNVYMDDPTLIDRVNAAALRYESLATEIVCKGIPQVKRLRFGSNWYNLTTEECDAWRDSCKEEPNCYRNVTRDPDLKYSY